MGRGHGYRKGREELASLAAGEGRIDPHDTGGILGQVSFFRLGWGTLHHGPSVKYHGC